MPSDTPTAPETISISTSTYLALPDTVEGLLAQRKKPQKATLADQVERCYLSLFSNKEFRKLREAVDRENTVEGSFIDDDVRSAEMIREEAKRQGDTLLAREKLSVLRRAIWIVERRYNATRTFRGSKD